MSDTKMIMPKEHGMWAWVLLPLIVGIGSATGPKVLGMPLLISVILWFLAFTPARMIYKNAKKGIPQSDNVIKWCIRYSALGLAFVYVSLSMQIRSLLVFAFFAPLFYFGVRASYAGYQRSFVFEITGIVFLSLLSFGGALTVSGTLSQADVAVWAVLLLFLIDRNLQARNAVRGGDWFGEEPPKASELRFVFRINIFIALASLLIASLLLEYFMMAKIYMAAFLPGFLATGFFFMRPPTSVKSLGWMEVAVAVSYAIIFLYLKSTL